MNFVVFNVRLGYWGLTELKAILRSFFFFLSDMSKQRLLFSLAIALVLAAGWKGLRSALLAVGMLHVLGGRAAARWR